MPVQSEGIASNINQCIISYRCLYKGTVVQDENRCDCDVPCRRITYQPQLSYAHLSKLNVETIWEGNPQRKAQIQDKYNRAREVDNYTS